MGKGLIKHDRVGMGMPRIEPVPFPFPSAEAIITNFIASNIHFYYIEIY